MCGCVFVFVCPYCVHSQKRRARLALIDSNPLAAFETLSLCLAHRHYFVTKTRVFSTYFPLILRHVAHSPESCAVYVCLPLSAVCGRVCLCVCGVCTVHVPPAD